MKLQFKHQKFQVDAAKAVVDVFAGQPYLTSSYKMDRGVGDYQISMMSNGDFTGWGNQPVIPELDDQMILDHIRTIQRDNQIAPSEKLEGKYNLTIEMETGVGKTYTYIKTMYELNKHYGWSKFIIVVPSIAIREGVYKTFQVTQEHFAEEYGRKINYFIYNSSKLTEIDRFASDNSINVMIINSQAFNAKGRDARRIHMRLDEFRSRRPIDIIAATHPIVVIDEPQSVEGKQTKKNLKEFHPLMMLRYSATHKKDSIYNMVYRLDAMEAYNKKLVKKIAVKGIQETGTNATDSYVYLEGINLSDTDPTATIQFHVKGTAGLKTVSKRAGIGLNLYTASGELEEYHNNFIVKNIDGRDDSIEFLNGIKLYAGDVIGRVSEEQFRRIQIRETILSHIERERQLFYKGIKVLSLFFIDEVDHYRKYDEAGRPQNGIFADMFEQEYVDVVKNLQLREGEREYGRYLQSIHAEKTHAGYFSVDRKGHMVNSKLGRVDAISDDADAYDLIMKNKELLLERDPGKSPVRFIFSHSALKEGWDNPNVFQICTLKQSSSDIRKRQEVGRGMRLCVNEDGERMDENALRADVHNVNVLTIIASESYDQFAKGLQTEIAEAVSDRPRQVTVDLFENALVHDKDGNEEIVDASMARRIIYYMTRLGYLDENDHLTEIFYRDKEDGKVSFGIALDSYRRDFLNILNCIYDATRMRPENARRYDVELRLDAEKLAMLEFKNLWEQINIRTAYAVDFDTEELVRKAIAALNLKLHVPKIFFRLEYGVMTEIRSKEELIEGTAFKKKESESYDEHPMPVNTSVKYDLIGKLVDETELTRKTIIHILTGMKETVFKQFQDNPEEFIIQAAEIINDEKAAVIIEHITYHILDDKYDTEILENAVIKGKLDVNAMKTEKHVYDHVVYDSENERRFVEELEASQEVAVYVKLPRRFYISTPVGNYTPDWAIAFKKGTVKHIYFVAETKGSADTGGLRGIEQAKINCAKEHFKAISGENVTYDVVDNYQKLLEMARG